MGEAAGKAATALRRSAWSRDEVRMKWKARDLEGAECHRAESTLLKSVQSVTALGALQRAAGAHIPQLPAQPWAWPCPPPIDLRL